MSPTDETELERWPALATGPRASAGSSGGETGVLVAVAESSGDCGGDEGCECTGARVRKVKGRRMPASWAMDIVFRRWGVGVCGSICGSICGGEFAVEDCRGGLQRVCSGGFAVGDWFAVEDCSGGEGLEWRVCAGVFWWERVFVVDEDCRQTDGGVPALYASPALTGPGHPVQQASRAAIELELDSTDLRKLNTGAAQGLLVCFVFVFSFSFSFFFSFPFFSRSFLSFFLFSFLSFLFLLFFSFF